MLRKMVLAILVIIITISSLTGCTVQTTTSGEVEKTFINIATGDTSGTYYPLGETIANIFNDNIKTITANAQITGASVENIGLLRSKNTELAFVQNDISYYAWTGTESFEGKEKIDNMRGMAMLCPVIVHILATENSGIKTIYDLKGKNVSVGAPGSGTEINARQILAEYGITYDDLGKFDNLSFKEVADQLKNNQVDAVFVTGDIPTTIISEITKTTDIVIIPVDPSKIVSLNEKYPFYKEVIIPANTYNNQSTDVVATAVTAMLVVPNSLDESLVYNLTKVLFEKGHDKDKNIKLESALSGMPISIHPGAQLYYNEKGAM